MAFNTPSLTMQDSWHDFAALCESESSYILRGGPISCSAPAAKVFSVLTDASTWPAWSTFVPSITIQQPADTTVSSPHTLTPGTTMKWGITMNATQPERLTASELVVDAVLTPEESAQGQSQSYWATWSTVGVPRWLHFGRRLWRIEDCGEEGCRISTTDYQRGPLTCGIWAVYDARLKEAFEISCQDLKGYCEK